HFWKASHDSSAPRKITRSGAPITHSATVVSHSARISCDRPAGAGGISTSRTGCGACRERFGRIGMFSAIRLLLQPGEPPLAPFVEVVQVVEPRQLVGAEDHTRIRSEGLAQPGRHLATAPPAQPLAGR